MSDQPNAVVPYAEFSLAKVDPETTLAAVRENVGPLGFNEQDLDRIKIPSGDTLAFGLTSMEEVDYVKEVHGIVLFQRDVRRFWEGSYDDTGGGVPPDCISEDAFRGAGEPGGECKTCANAQWGSATLGDKPARGQACSQRRLMFVLVPDALLPALLSVPPTSLKPVRQFLLRLGSRGIPYYGAVVTFSLLGTKSADGVDYATLKMALGERLDAKGLALIQKTREALMPALQSMKASEEDFGREETAGDETAGDETAGDETADEEKGDDEGDPAGGTGTSE